MAYQLPGGYRRLSKGLEVYEDRHCGRTAPSISTTPPVPVPVPSAVPVPDLPVPVPVPTAVPVPTPLPAEVTGLTQSLLDRINQLAYPLNGAAPAPPCRKQPNFNWAGESTRFPHVKAK